MKKLGDLQLPDGLQWTDRHDWPPVAQEVVRTLTFTADSRDITTALPEYSLLRLTYRTRCLAWTAADVRDEEILFLVTD